MSPTPWTYYPTTVAHLLDVQELFNAVCNQIIVRKHEMELLEITIHCEEKRSFYILPTCNYAG